MSNMQRFKMKHIKENDFAQLIEDDLDEAFLEAHRQNLTKELPNGFVQANVTLNFDFSGAKIRRCKR